MCCRVNLYQCDDGQEGGEVLMRFYLLGQGLQKTRPQSSLPGFFNSIDLKWLLLCLLAPLSWWFFLLGLVAALAPAIECLYIKTVESAAVEKEFHEFLLYLLILPDGLNMHSSISLASEMITSPTLRTKIDELNKSLLLGNVEEISTDNMSESFRSFIGVLKNHQEIGLNLSSTLNKLSALIEDRYYIMKKSDIKRRPVLFTYVQAAVAFSLLLYMYYPMGVTIIRGLAR